MEYTLLALASLPSQAWSQMAPMSGGYYILSVTSEDKVPSRLKLLHEGVSFLLMREKICSSAALEWGILNSSYFCHTKKQTKS